LRKWELWNAVSKVDEYRGFAATALDMAEKATDPCGKTRLLDMAEAWLSLGERTSHPPKQSGRALREHPLIAETLGRYKAELE
jgi:hypothetical protein